MSQLPDRYTKGPGKTEISQFKVAFAINQNVLQLQIPMHHSVRVTECDTTAELIHIALMIITITHKHE